MRPGQEAMIAKVSGPPMPAVAPHPAEPRPPAPFDALPDHAWHSLLRAARPIIAAPGDVLVHRGQTPSGVLWLRHGLLRAGAVSADGRAWTERLVLPGRTIGESALPEGLPNLTEIVALHPCSVKLFPRSACLALLHSHPTFAWALLAVASQRLQAMAQRLERQATHGLRARLAWLLMEIAEVDDGALLAAGLPQSELAGLVGASREAVNRELRALCEGGSLQRTANGWRVCEAEALARLAAGGPAMPRARARAGTRRHLNAASDAAL